MEKYVIVFNKVHFLKKGFAKGDLWTTSMDEAITFSPKLWAEYRLNKLRMDHPEEHHNLTRAELMEVKRT